MGFHFISEKAFLRDLRNLEPLWCSTAKTTWRPKSHDDAGAYKGQTPGQAASVKFSNYFPNRGNKYCYTGTLRQTETHAKVVQKVRDSRGYCPYRVLP